MSQKSKEDLFIEEFRQTHSMSFSLDELTKETKKNLNKEIIEVGEKARLRSITNNGGCYPHTLPKEIENLK